MSVLGLEAPGIRLKMAAESHEQIEAVLHRGLYSVGVGQWIRTIVMFLDCANSTKEDAQQGAGPLNGW